MTHYKATAKIQEPYSCSSTALHLLEWRINFTWGLFHLHYNARFSLIACLCGFHQEFHPQLYKVHCNSGKTHHPALPHFIPSYHHLLWYSYACCVRVLLCRRAGIVHSCWILGWISWKLIRNVQVMFKMFKVIFHPNRLKCFYFFELSNYFPVVLTFTLKKLWVFRTKLDKPKSCWVVST